MSQTSSLHTSPLPLPQGTSSPAQHWSGAWSAYLPLTQTRLVGLAGRLTQPFCSASESFWEQPIHLHFVGILAQAESYFLPGQPVFVARHPLPNHPEVELEVRLSRSGCQWLLASVLGESPADNDETLLSQLTSLETHILHGWCDSLFKETSACLPMPAVSEPLSAGASTLDFLWMIGQPDAKGRHNAGLPINEDGEFGKLILRMPKSYLRYFLAQPPETAGTMLSDKALHHALPTVSISVGQTRLTLDDAHHLEPGDVLMLEHSHLDRMTVSTHDAFEVAPHASTAASFDARIALSSAVQRAITVPLPAHVLAQFQEEPAMTPTQTPNHANAQFWQQVHIDVNATFEPVRVPLLELQQLSEGLIMEVGDLTRNAIHLQVDGKTIASGELVIIGDKFGVRVTQVEADAKASSPAPIVADIAPVNSELSGPETGYADNGKPSMAMEDSASEGMPMAVDSDDEGGMPMAVDSGEDGNEDDW